MSRTVMPSRESVLALAAGCQLGGGGANVGSRIVAAICGFGTGFLNFLSHVWTPLVGSRVQTPGIPPSLILGFAGEHSAVVRLACVH